MNAPSSSPDFIEALPRERHSELLAFRYKAEDQLGLNPLANVSDSGAISEKAFRNRVVEMPQRMPTKEQFALMLEMGDLMGQSAAAIEALRLYAYDESYPSRHLALEVLASRDQLAATLYAKFQRQEKERVGAELAKNPDPHVPSCIHDKAH